METLEFAAAPPAPIFLWGMVGTLSAVLVFLLLVGWWALRRNPGRARFLTWFIPGMAAFEIALFGSLALVNFRRAPVGYELTAETITVHSRSRELAFPLAGFDSARRDVDGRWRITYRAWMSCQKQGRIGRGPWGVHGVTRPPGLPWANVHVTRPANAVALEGRVNLIVSPEEPDRFAAEVERRLASARAGGAT